MKTILMPEDPHEIQYTERKTMTYSTIGSDGSVHVLSPYLSLAESFNSLVDDFVLWCGQSFMLLY